MSDNTLSELFARDPHSLSDQDIDEMTEHYREARKTFVKGGATKGPKPEASLADLGLL
jgi:hypothetical protein